MTSAIPLSRKGSAFTNYSEDSFKGSPDNVTCQSSPVKSEIASFGPEKIEEAKTVTVPSTPIRKDILIKAILKAVRGIVINQLKPNFDYSLSYKDLKVYMRKATFL